MEPLAPYDTIWLIWLLGGLLFFILWVLLMYAIIRVAVAHAILSVDRKRRHPRSPGGL